MKSVAFSGSQWFPGRRLEGNQGQQRFLFAQQLQRNLFLHCFPHDHPPFLPLPPGWCGQVNRRFLSMNWNSGQKGQRTMDSCGSQGSQLKGPVKYGDWVSWGRTGFLHASFFFPSVPKISLTVSPNPSVPNSLSVSLCSLAPHVSRTVLIFPCCRQEMRNTFFSRPFRKSSTVIMAYYLTVRVYLGFHYFHCPLETRGNIPPTNCCCQECAVFRGTSRCSDMATCPPRADGDGIFT